MKYIIIKSNSNINIFINLKFVKLLSKINYKFKLSDLIKTYEYTNSIYKNLELFAFDENDTLCNVKGHDEQEFTSILELSNQDRWFIIIFWLYYNKNNFYTLYKYFNDNNILYFDRGVQFIKLCSLYNINGYVLKNKLKLITFKFHNLMFIDYFTLFELVFKFNYFKDIKQIICTTLELLI